MVIIIINDNGRLRHLPLETEELVGDQPELLLRILEVYYTIL